jgi:hypothetical protein
MLQTSKIQIFFSFFVDHLQLKSFLGTSKTSADVNTHPPELSSDLLKSQDPPSASRTIFTTSLKRYKNNGLDYDSTS